MCSSGQTGPRMEPSPLRRVGTRSPHAVLRPSGRRAGLVLFSRRLARFIAEIHPGVVLANLAASARNSMSCGRLNVIAPAWLRSADTAFCSPSGTVKTLICVTIPVFAFHDRHVQFLMSWGGTARRVDVGGIRTTTRQAADALAPIACRAFAKRRNGASWREVIGLTGCRSWVFSTGRT